MRPSLMLLNNWPLLLYGWLFSFSSGFGQTYFISIFGGVIRSDFELDHGSFGLSYSAGTLISGCLLFLFGRLIDTVSLRYYSLAVVFGLAAATLAMSVAESLVALTLVFFLLRLFGQGLMSHAAATTMARYFAARRGSAIAFAATGHVAGGALLPLMGAALLSVGHWRQIWWLSSLALMLIVAPIVAYLLSAQWPQSGGSVSKHDTGVCRQPGKVTTVRKIKVSRERSLAEAVRDQRFYAYLAVLLAPSFVTTGLIFHQVHIGAQKGWGLNVIAWTLSIYAIAQFATTFLVGHLIDRYSARLLIPVSLVPMIAACFVLAQVTSTNGAFGAFILLGLGSGATTVLMGAVWAEEYGTKHLGAITSVAASGSVLASALAPGLFGVLLDQQWTVAAISLLCACYCTLVSLLAYALTRA